jgi:hypothetical protein
MFCLLTRFVAWNYCAASGLAFTGRVYVQGDKDLKAVLDFAEEAERFIGRRAREEDS